MNCSICSRSYHAQKRPFLCAVDGRNRIYEGRVENARALLENEEIEREVNRLLAEEKRDIVGTADPSKIQLEKWKSNQAAATDRTSQIIAQADRLRSEVDAARQEIQAKNKALARRRSDLASVSSGIEARRTRQLDETSSSIQRLRFHWHRNAETLAATRAFLCEEAARLYGLRQIKKGSSKRYEIGGVEMVELHNMNSMTARATIGEVPADVYRYFPRNHFDVSCTCCPYPISGNTLPCGPSSCRDNASSPGLPAAHHIYATFIIQPRGGAISRISPATADFDVRQSARATSSTSLRRQVVAYTGQGRSVDILVFSRRRDASCV